MTELFLQVRKNASPWETVRKFKTDAKGKIHEADRGRYAAVIEGFLEYGFEVRAKTAAELEARAAKKEAHR